MFKGWTKFEKVLLFSDVKAYMQDDEVLMLDKTLGNPTIKGATVEGVIVKHGKGSKIKIFKYKRCRSKN